MLDALLAMAMGFFFSYGLSVLLLVAALSVLDDMLLSVDTGRVMLPSSLASVVVLRAVAFEVFWPLRVVRHKPLDVVSFKCCWQLGWSLYYQPLDDAASFQRWFGLVWRGRGRTSCLMLWPKDQWCRPLNDFSFKTV